MLAMKRNKEEMTKENDNNESGEDSDSNSDDTGASDNESELSFEYLECKLDFYEY